MTPVPPPNFGPDTGANGLQAGDNIDDTALFSMLGLSAAQAGVMVPTAYRDLKSEYLRAGVPENRIPKVLPKDTVGTPMAQVLQGFYNMPGSTRENYQRRLLSGGFYSSTNQLIQGDPDPDTIRAYTEAARRAVLTGKTVDDVLDESAGKVSPGDVNKALGPGAVRGKAQVKVTNPDDLRAVAQKISAQVLGRGFDANQLGAFVASYQAMERGEAASGTQAPSAQTAVETMARQANPAAAHQQDLADSFKMMTQAMESLGGGGGGG